MEERGSLMDQGPEEYDGRVFKRRDQLGNGRLIPHSWDWGWRCGSQFGVSRLGWSRAEGWRTSNQRPQRSRRQRSPLVSEGHGSRKKTIKEVVAEWGDCPGTRSWQKCRWRSGYPDEAAWISKLLSVQLCIFVFQECLFFMIQLLQCLLQEAFHDFIPMHTHSASTGWVGSLWDALEAPRVSFW